MKEPRIFLVETFAAQEAKVLPHDCGRLVLTRFVSPQRLEDGFVSLRDLLLS